jgi:hypothetical protein
MIKRIISGGQTGADRAALDFAIKMGLPPKQERQGIKQKHMMDAQKKFEVKYPTGE